MNAISPMDPLPNATPWQTSQWFNAPADFGLDKLRGQVVVLHTFQMLCPGCVSHGLPQAKRVRATFSPQDVAVVGLHTVFEHHAVMTPDALGAFLHEYRISFPVGVDIPGSPGPVPKTMEAYGLRGTPSVLLFDREGALVSRVFGQLEDMSLGAAISALVEHPREGANARPDAPSGCDDEGCVP